MALPGLPGPCRGDQLCWRGGSRRIGGGERTWDLGETLDVSTNIWRILWTFSRFYEHLVDFFKMILWTFSGFYEYVVDVWWCVVYFFSSLCWPNRYWITEPHGYWWMSHGSTGQSVVHRILHWYFMDIQWIEILKMGPNFWIFLATEKWGVSWIHPMVSLLYWVSNSLNGSCLPLGNSLLGIDPDQPDLNWDMYVIYVGVSWNSQNPPCLCCKCLSLMAGDGFEGLSSCEKLRFGS